MAKSKPAATPVPEVPKKVTYKVTKTVDVSKGVFSITVEGKTIGITDEEGLIKLPYAVKVHAMMDGFIRRLAAVAREGGAKAAIKQMELFAADKWTTRGNGSSNVPMVVQALARIKDWELPQAVDVWSKQTKEKKAAIRSNPEVRKMQLAIEEEQVAEVKAAAETEGKPVEKIVDALAGL